MTLPGSFAPVMSIRNWKSSEKRFFLERVKGIEPSYRAWEARVLPLNYTRKGANRTRVTGR